MRFKVKAKNIHCPLCHTGDSIQLESYSTRTNHMYRIGSREPAGIRDIDVNIEAICHECNTTFSIDTKLRGNDNDLFELEIVEEDIEEDIKADLDDRSIEHYVRYQT